MNSRGIFLALVLSVALIGAGAVLYAMLGSMAGPPVQPSLMAGSATGKNLEASAVVFAPPRPQDAPEDIAGGSCWATTSSWTPRPMPRNTWATS